MPNPLIRATLVGRKTFSDKIKSLAQAFPDRVAGALYHEAQIEKTESQRECPVDVTPHAPHPGQLRNSARVEQPERHGRNISVAIVYGTEYAVYVHENLEAHHEVGSAKFLERPLKASAPFMSERIARRLK